MVKCSLPLIGHVVPPDLPLQFAKVPVSEAKFMILNVLPSAGLKPLIRFTVRLPFRPADLVTFNWSKLVPAVVPPIEIPRVPPEAWVYVPLSERMPVWVKESPGLMTPLDVTAVPVIVPLPNSDPPFRLSVPEAFRVRLPSSVVVPAVCVNRPVPPTVKALPEPMVKVPVFVRFPPVVNPLPLPVTVRLPLLVKAPAVLNRRPPATVNFPLLALVAKLARPLPPVWLIICEEMPVNVKFAALVTMLAPLNCSVPVTL